MAAARNDTFVSELIAAYAQLYALLYRRRDPRAHRPSGESLAVIEHLLVSGPLTVTEAARHFDRSQAAMSEIVDRLVRRRLLDRAPDARDRRRRLVWPTVAGRELLAEERSVLSRELVASAVARMTAGSRTALATGVRALLAAAEGARKEHLFPTTGDRP